MDTQDQKHDVNAGVKKSMFISILLTLLFGPLGMFYSTIKGAVVMLVITIAAAIFTLGYSVIITWLVCIIWGAVAVNKYNEKLRGEG